jgi:2-polyprenyl-3-methyl-5-hydroxy-6-metoxy-1,4-benzoquinol methylase
MGHNDRWDDIWNEKRRATSGRFGLTLARDIIYRTVTDILKREIPDARGKRILEPGSGTGLVSLELARRGADVTLFDLSPEAVRLSKGLFQRQQTRETTVQGTILSLPFRDNTFDVTWNGGVIEHFEKPDQVEILREMLRVTKPDGKVIVIVPSAMGKIYMQAKAYADRHNLWQPGYEVPMSTLSHLVPDLPAALIREYSTGFMAQLHFMKYYFAGSRPLRLAWCGLVELLSLALFPLNRRPGYLLVSVLRKTT